MNGAPKLHPSRLRVLYDENGIEIPPYHVDDEVIKAQVLHEGPEIPQELWKRPERPVGFVGYKGSQLRGLTPNIMQWPRISGSASQIEPSCLG